MTNAATTVTDIFTNEEDGYAVEVASITGGFSVTIRDLDADEYIGSVRIYPTHEAALAYAETL